VRLVLIILTALFGFLATVCVLVLSLGFPQYVLDIFPILEKFATTNKPYFFVATLVSLACAYGATALREYLSEKEKPALEIVIGPHGEQVQEATLSGFDKEVEDAAEEMKRNAKNYFNAGKADSTQHRYKDAAANYQKSIDALPTMSAYLNLGTSLLYISDFPGAEDAWISGLQIALKKQMKEFEGSFLGNIGLAYAEQGKLEEAVNALQESLEIYQQLGNQLGQASALGNIGAVHIQRGKWEEVMNPLQEALEIYQQNGNPLGQANVLGNIGIFYRIDEKPEEALKCHQEALELHKQIGNPLGQANALSNIGNIYTDQRKLEEALNYQKEALEIHRQIDDQLGQANDLSNIGNVYFHQDEPEEALKCHRDALEIHKQIGSVLGQAQVLSNIGTCYAKHGEFEKALDYCKQARIIFLKIGAKGKN